MYKILNIYLHSLSKFFTKKYSLSNDISPYIYLYKVMELLKLSTCSHSPCIQVLPKETND